MSDTIGRQKAVEELRKMAIALYGYDATSVISCAIYKLQNLPSAESEIIRCKDCENWIPGYITDNDDFIPPKCGKYQQMVGHSSNDYCSLAERRTDE